mgnify:CR=1 FL=1
MLELARQCDWEAVNRLSIQIHDLHAAWRPDIYEMVDELYPEERVQQGIAARELYVAKLSGTVIGYVLLKTRNYDWTGVVKRKVMVVDEICVEELCRGSGIGKQIMAEARALAKAFGCMDMQLGVYPQNDDAIGFYQRCGFQIQNIGMQKKV